jgi:hypothetical protein
MDVETTSHEFGTNPCGEIILRPNGLCNLSEVVVRSRTALTTLEKVELATIIGTFQSTLTISGTFDLSGNGTPKKNDSSE